MQEWEPGFVPTESGECKGCDSDEVLEDTDWCYDCTIENSEARFTEWADSLYDAKREGD